MAFEKTGSLRPGHSLFDLSYNKKFDADMGKLYPVCCEEVVPGDRFKIGNAVVIRFNPLVAPILHEINVYVHYFFVPFRLLWPKNNVSDDLATEGWEVFYSGGRDGNLAPVLPFVKMDSTFANGLYDHLGMPITSPGPVKVNAFPFSAYQFIWDEYYRDPNLQPTQGYLLHSGDNTAPLGEIHPASNLYYRCWEKDYFTSCLPWQQRGDAPALPVTGIVNADGLTYGSGAVGDALNVGSVSNLIQIGSSVPGVAEVAAVSNWLEQLTVTGSSVDISDLRLAIQMQKWMERSARGGPRYIEQLKAHFGVSPSDSRLQRPEYIGGSKYPCIISEVVQTSETLDSPQGNLAGHGVVSNGGYAGSYNATEFGLIMGLLSIMPRSAYQNGLNRQWSRETRWDYYSPEFAHLSEQPVLNRELYAIDGDTADAGLFGYQGRYDEMRYKPDCVCGGMRSTFDYWHLGRQFNTTPVLNSSFVACDDVRKDIFAVPTEPGFIINFGNNIRAYRPMPAMSDPGLMDHF